MQGKLDHLVFHVKKDKSTDRCSLDTWKQNRRLYREKFSERNEGFIRKIRNGFGRTPKKFLSDLLALYVTYHPLVTPFHISLRQHHY